MSLASYFLVLKILLIIAAFYMLVEAVIHFSGIRLIGLEVYWPTVSIAFVREFILLWGGACLAFSFILFKLQRSVHHYHDLLITLKYCALGLAAAVFYASLSPLHALPTPTSHVFIPQYSWWLRFEALLLSLFALYIQYGQTQQFVRSTVKS